MISDVCLCLVENRYLRKKSLLKSAARRLRSLPWYVSLLALLVLLVYRWWGIPPRGTSGSLTTEVDIQAPLTFFLVGDTGESSPSASQVGRAMQARCRELGGKVDGVFLLGDNFYKAGVRSVRDPQWKSKFGDHFGHGCLSQTKFFALLGNHDYRGNAQAQIDKTEDSSQWFMPGRFYSVRFGDLLKVIIFDSNFADFCLNSRLCSLDFLRSQLAERLESWQVVMAHHPIQSVSDRGSRHRGGVFGALVKPWICGRADAWISGHAHHLEITEDPSCRMDFIVSGAGGADLYPIRESDPSETFAISRHGFMEWDVRAEAYKVTVRDLDNKILHEHTNPNTRMMQNQAKNPK